MGRVLPRRVVGRRSGGDRGGGRRTRYGGYGARALGPDARRRSRRRRGLAFAARRSVGRCQIRRRACGLRGAGRGPAPPARQPAGRRDGWPEPPVAARQRARHLCVCEVGLAAEGLAAHAPHGRGRGRTVRRVGHPALRPSRRRLVPRGGRSPRPSRGAAGPAGLLLRRRRKAHGGCRGGTRVATRSAGRDGCGRHGRRHARRGAVAAGARAAYDRHGRPDRNAAERART